MKRFTWAALAAVTLAAALAPGRASAQVPYQQPLGTNPFQRPTFSPYLNMVRGGNPALNYYGLVRPQMTTNRTLQTLESQQLELGKTPGGAFVPVQEQQQSGLGGMPATGHRTTFFNYGTYFPSWTGQGGGRTGLGGTQTVGQAPGGKRR